VVQIRRLGDPPLLFRHEDETGTLHDLTDIEEGNLLVPLLDGLGEEHGGKVRPPFRQHGGGGGIRAPFEDLQVDALSPVKSLFIGHIITGELCLGQPLGEEGHGPEFRGPGWDRPEKNDQQHRGRDKKTAPAGVPPAAPMCHPSRRACSL